MNTINLPKACSAVAGGVAGEWGEDGMFVVSFTSLKVVSSSAYQPAYPSLSTDLPTGLSTYLFTCLFTYIYVLIYT